jgi:predicted cobalt transporter CbtA
MSALIAKCRHFSREGKMLVTAIVLALICAAIEYFVGIAEPWRKIVFAGVVVLFIIGLVQLLAPGIIPLHLT